MDAPGAGLRRSGPLSSNVAEACAFVRSDPNLAEADLQFHFGPAYFVENGFADYDGHALTIGPVLISPRSRGWIELASADPAAKPRIPNTLAEPADAAALVAGVKLAREIAAAEPLAASPTPIQWTICEVDLEAGFGSMLEP